MDNNKVGKFIARLRKEKGLTQQELGDKLYVTDKAVSKWERGISFPDITILEKLAEILEADVSEILCGERIKNKKIDTQKEIDKAINKINEEQKLKKEKIRKKVKNISIVISSVIIFVILLLITRYNSYHPSIIKEGNNDYELGFFGKYNLEKNGLDEMSKIMDITDGRSDDKSNIVNLDIKLNDIGNVEGFNFSVYYFNSNLEYLGSGYYNYENNNLYYEYQAKNDYNDRNDYEVDSSLVRTYSKSNNIDYLNNYIKRIPFNEQIKLVDSKSVIVGLNDNKYVTEDTCVCDMRDNKNIKVLSVDDYNKCLGGKLSSGLYTSITLSFNNKSGSFVYDYIIDTLDGDIKQVDFNMQTDYYINGKNELLFTRDYGVTWIKADISSDDVEETLNFYRDLSLKNSSWFISTNELVPIAYFYGKDAKLKISTDNGLTWNEKTFNLFGDDMYKDIAHRIVGFTDQNFGYVALGTDWTMGSGEAKGAYLTTNSGVDWYEIRLPENCTSKTLKDFIMYDENNGIVLLQNTQSEEFPYMYSTKNGGESWEAVQYSDEIPNDVYYISNIDSIEKENDIYTIVLSQGDSSTTKVKLTSSNLIDWNYITTFTSNIHTVG